MPVCALLQHAALAETGYVSARIGLYVFGYALLARLSRMSLGVGVEIVGVDLELYGAYRLERLGLYYGHVVGGAYRGACYVAAGRPADVRYAGLYASEYGLHQPLLLHHARQGEGVAAADAYRLGLPDHAARVGGAVHRLDAYADLVEARLHLSYVFVVGECHGCVRHEYDRLYAAQQTAYLLNGVFEVLLARIGGIGN